MKTLLEIEKEFDDFNKEKLYAYLSESDRDKIKQFYRQQFEEVLKEIVPEIAIDQRNCSMADETCIGYIFKEIVKENILIFLGKKGENNGR